MHLSSSGRRLSTAIISSLSAVPCFFRRWDRNPVSGSHFTAPSPQSLSVNGDGDVDYVLHFRTRDADIPNDAIEACLTGETTNGQAIGGCDAIRIVAPWLDSYGDSLGVGDALASSSATPWRPRWAPISSLPAPRALCTPLGRRTSTAPRTRTALTCSCSPSGSAPTWGSAAGGHAVQWWEV